jgi:hypothetical protein
MAMLKTPEPELFGDASSLRLLIDAVIDTRNLHD